MKKFMHNYVEQLNVGLLTFSEYDIGLLLLCFQCFVFKAFYQKNSLGMCNKLASSGFSKLNSAYLVHMGFSS